MKHPNMQQHKQPLYHGTDLRILKMSKEERAEFKKCCVIAIDYLWQFIKPYNEIVWKTVTIPSQPEPIKVQSSRLSELESLLKDEEDPYIYRNLMQAITCNELRLQPVGGINLVHT